MRERMCPSYPDFPVPLVLVLSCDQCGALAVYARGESPEGWLVERGAVLCPMCRREAE